MNRRGALLALSVAGPFAPRPAGANLQTAPETALELLRTADLGGWPLLRAQAGDAEDAWLVDTGSTHHVVDGRWAAARSLEARGRIRLTTITGTRMARQWALPALRSGALEWPAMTAVEADLDAYDALTGVRLAGILGMPLWVDSAWQLDFDRGRLRRVSRAVAVDGPSAPLEIDEGLPVVSLALGAREPERFLLDTGNPGTLIVFAHRAAALLAEAPALPRRQVREPGGEVEVAYALLDALRIGEQGLSQVPIVLESPSQVRRGAHFDRLAGSLGTALFEGGALTLDPAARRWHARLSPQPLPGGFGFTLRAGTPGPSVQAVINGGPAARQGVAPDDTLLAIDGTPVKGLRPTSVWARLRPLDGALLRWRRRSDSRERETALERERFFPRLS